MWQSQTSRSPVRGRRRRAARRAAAAALSTFGRQRLGHAVAVAALGGEVGAHVAVARPPRPSAGRSGRAGCRPRSWRWIVRRWLAMNQPGLSAAENELCVPAKTASLRRQLAERDRAVARAASARPRPTPGSRRRSRRERPTTSATSGHQRSRTRGGARRQRPTARAPRGARLRPAPAPLQHHEQLGWCRRRPGTRRRRSPRPGRASVGLSTTKHAERERADAAQGAPPAWTRRGAHASRRRRAEPAPPRPRDRAPRPRRRPPAPPSASRSAQRSGRRRRRRAARAPRLRTSSSVSSSSPSTTGERPRAQDQQHAPPAARPTTPAATPAAQHRDPPVRSDRDRGRERQQREQRQHDAEHAHVVRDGAASARRSRAGAASAGRARSPRAARSASFGETERSAKRTSFGGVADVEQRVAPARARRRAGWPRPPRVRNTRRNGSDCDHRVHDRLEQRTRRHQVGRPAVDQVARRSRAARPCAHGRRRAPRRRDRRRPRWSRISVRA